MPEAESSGLPEEAEEAELGEDAADVEDAGDTGDTGDTEELESSEELEPVEHFSDDQVQQRILESEVVFEGKVWNVRRERFAYNDHDIVREFVEHPGAVAVLAIDEQERVLLIQQYRHPIRERDWELPAGLLDVEDEPPLTTARRELAEEADLEASDWAELIDFHSSPGGSTELVRVYLARGLFASEEGFHRKEEEADIRIHWVPLAEVVRGVLAGRLRNSILMIAVLTASAKIAESD